MIHDFEHEELSRWYRGRLVGGPFRPFDQDELDALEREVGLALPAAYRSFLEMAGGGSLAYSVHLSACEPEPLQGFEDPDDFDAYLDSLFIDPDMAKDAWAEVADSESSDRWRRTVEEWLDKELPGWRAEAWALP